MGVIQQSLHEAKIRDIDGLQKRLMQTCFECKLVSTLTGTSSMLA